MEHQPEPPSHPSAFSRKLNKVLGEGHFTASELAEEADVTTRHLRKVKNQRAHLNHEAADRIRRYCCRNGDPRLSETTCCAGYELTQRGEARANGTIDDEMADMMETLGDAVTAYRGKDKQALSSIILDTEAIIERLKAERDRI